MASKSKSKPTTPTSNIEANISGAVSGQIAIGENITQTQTTQANVTTVTEADRAALHELITELKTQITSRAPADKQKVAFEKTTELEEALTAEKPDLTTMEYVKNWFGKNLPQLAGAVTGLIVNPIVGKLVEASGEALVHEFKRRFGQA